eukprot:2793-Heterococcus_DN1.PRE.3
MTAVYRGHKPAAAWLLQQGVADDAVDTKGCTALHYAVAYCANESAIVELLLANGAEVNIRCSNDRTPLDVAATKGFVAVAKLLIAAGADVLSANKSTMTNTATALLAAGAVVRRVTNAVNKLGKTAAQVAHDSGNTQAEQLLIRAAR